MKTQTKIDSLTACFSTDDLLIKNFSSGGIGFALLYIDGFVDKDIIDKDILTPLIVKDCFPDRLDVNFLSATVCYAEEIEATEDEKTLIEAISEGKTILLCDNSNEAFIFSVRMYAKRAITEPPTESILKGPREGFIEDIRSNIILLRRRLQTPNLRIKDLSVGKYTKTRISVCYIKGITDQKMLNDVVSEIEKIDIDGIIDSSYVGRFVEKNKKSIFEQVGHLEKPDIAVSKLLEGRIIIVVDGSPIVLSLPYLLIETFQDSYDYYSRDARGSMLRLICFMGAVLTVYLPAIYVAMQEYHYHLLPLKFVVTLVDAVSGIPFTPPVEMLFVLLLFEVLYQASIRVPRYVGIALSVVGAIVLGETAVNAGLISSPAVLIIAISALGMNCVPSGIDTFSIIRMILLLTASVLGLYGIVILTVMILCYLCSSENYGAPYLAPYSPYISQDALQDGLLKDSVTRTDLRPRSLNNKNRRRLKGER